MMSNLLSETKKAIKGSGHKPGDIIFIGSTDSGHSCTWEEFEKLADFEYDNGYGGQEVAEDLRIVFSDGSSMWRGEYDGSEWWEYGEPFEMPKELRPIKTLCSGDLWTSLEQMNRPGGKYGKAA